MHEHKLWVAYTFQRFELKNVYFAQGKHLLMCFLKQALYRTAIQLFLNKDAFLSLHPKETFFLTGASHPSHFRRHNMIIFFKFQFLKALFLKAYNQQNIQHLVFFTSFWDITCFLPWLSSKQTFGDQKFSCLFFFNPSVLCASTYIEFHMQYLSYF